MAPPSRSRHWSASLSLWLLLLSTLGIVVVGGGKRLNSFQSRSFMKCGRRHDVHTSKVGSLRRSYALYVPCSIQGIGNTEKVPAVVALHGWVRKKKQWKAGAGHVIFNHMGLEGLAEKYRMVVVAPHGFKGSWNARVCCGPALAHNINDAAFLRMLVDDLPDCVDRTSVYALGISNGGYLSTENPELFAGIVANSGHADQYGQFSSPTPTLLLHSKGDPDVKYNGCCASQSRATSCCCSLSSSRYAPRRCTTTDAVLREIASVNECGRRDFGLDETAGDPLNLTVSYSGNDATFGEFSCLTASSGCAANSTLCSFAGDSHPIVSPTIDRMTFDFFAGQACASRNSGTWDAATMSCALCERQAQVSPYCHAAVIAERCSNLRVDEENGETDVDCGGVNCAGCGESGHCLVGTDCEAELGCLDGLCVIREPTLTPTATPRACPKIANMQRCSEQPTRALCLGRKSKALGCRWCSKSRRCVAVATFPNGKLEHKALAACSETFYAHCPSSAIHATTRPSPIRASTPISSKPTVTTSPRPPTRYPTRFPTRFPSRAPSSLAPVEAPTNFVQEDRSSEVTATTRFATRAQITISQAGRLNLCEVEAFTKGNARNIALGRRAIQSSTKNGGGASRATDGSLNTMFRQGTCTSTKTTRSEWWRVMLVEPESAVDEVVITSRSDSCCDQDIDGARIFVGGLLCGVLEYVSGVTRYVFDCAKAREASLAQSSPNVPDPTVVASPTVHGQLYNKFIQGRSIFGGTCTCPDGEVFVVGDNANQCGSLACQNGVSGACSLLPRKMQASAGAAVCVP